MNIGNGNSLGWGGFNCQRWDEKQELAEALEDLLLQSDPGGQPCCLLQFRFNCPRPSGARWIE